MQLLLFKKINILVSCNTTCCRLAICVAKGNETELYKHMWYCFDFAINDANPNYPTTISLVFSSKAYYCQRNLNIYKPWLTEQ